MAARQQWMSGMARNDKTAGDSGNNLAEIRKRVEANELRARDLESQARVLEARLHLAEMQKKYRERFPVKEPSDTN
jgi:chaperonin cofactor prefoldin